MKTCTVCLVGKDLSFFGKRSLSKDGLFSQCKACRSVKTASISREQKDEKNRKRNAAVAAKKDFYLKKWAEYRRSNKDNRRRCIAAWQRNNEERYKESLRSWRANNADALRASSANRRARIAAVGGRHSQGDIRKIIGLQGNKCANCKRALDSYHVDHVMPLHLGGSNDKSNIQVLCPSCNLRKSYKCPIAFAQQEGRLI